MEEESTSSDAGTCGKSHLDTWDSRICKKYFSDGCENGSRCQLKHCTYIKETTCRYFLLYNACRKGPTCPFLHEAKLRNLISCKIPNNSAASSQYSKKNPIKECAYYNLGFCKFGKLCNFQHVKKVLCQSPTCSAQSCAKFHFNLSDFPLNLQSLSFLQSYSKSPNIRCYKCITFGHKFPNCPK